MAKFPKITKKIRSFLHDEEGRISKHAIMTVGAIVGVAAASAVVNAATDVTGADSPLILSLDKNAHQITVTHSHHGSHGNHSSY
ncbi:MAG: hypothetical protein KJ601_02710 [Nanoarchaeota archaeon]|nr:hypothetical protein [Nanoarchaeota archaeon]MBU1704461.1 hypothetical protein [Nanoarchaeota archaeon]